jgi:hypothetical protein
MRIHPNPLPALFAGLLLASGCFIEPGEPPGFRYDCSSDDECVEGEKCIASLCQLPCTTATFAEDCPQDGSSLACFNGVCASSCDAEANPDPCPGATSCMAFDLSEFGQDDVAICGQSCADADAPPCPGAEICLEGVCIDPTAGDTTAGGESGGTTGGY